ncbi:sulfotransferase [Vulcanococcus limneticus]|uniref:sulfotransferase n=1 Tax=Vulcanococcus limneticus TaxID=2170428 RepID=UPI00398C0BB1
MIVRSKVFGIGLNKTGTTTLGVCLQHLGCRHASFDLRLLEQVSAGDLAGLHRVVDLHDSFEDWPYPLLFEHLDAAYPGSRFILTRRRSPEVWLSSLEAHALRTDPAEGSRARTLAYGCPYPQLARVQYLARYEAHLVRVRHHFRDRPSQLLEVCWEEQADWTPLCGFLGVETPRVPFPHANAATLPKPERLLQNQEAIRRLSADAGGDDPPVP